MSTGDRDHVLGLSRPSAFPIYPSSVYAIPDIDTLELVSDGVEPGFIYARDKHPNSVVLASRLAELESASWGVITSSGMGAITAGLLSFLRAGDHVVASDQLYGRTAQWLGQELARFGVTTTWTDVGDREQMNRAFDVPVRCLIVETISNPLLRVCDLSQLAQIAHSHGALLVVDNTFATPVLCKPLEMGADLVIESLTKLIGGHSDVTLGCVLGADAEIGKAIATTASIWGMPASPFDCWLAMRSIPTLRMRVTQASANALRLATWLRTHSGVSSVIYPGIDSHPDHALAGRILSGDFGNMVTFEVPGGRDAVNLFMRRSSSIPFCPSLGGTTTTCSYPAGTSHRYMDHAEKARLGITEGLIRLSVGIEPYSEIESNLSHKLG